MQENISRALSNLWQKQRRRLDRVLENKPVNDGVKEELHLNEGQLKPREVQRPLNESALLKGKAGR